jgi:hypothetical protein
MHAHVHHTSIHCSYLWSQVSCPVQYASEVQYTRPVRRELENYESHFLVEILSTRHGIFNLQFSVPSLLPFCITPFGLSIFARINVQTSATLDGLVGFALQPCLQSLGSEAKVQWLQAAHDGRVMVPVRRLL